MECTACKSPQLLHEIASIFCSSKLSECRSEEITFREALSAEMPVQNCTSRAPGNPSFLIVINFFTVNTPCEVSQSATTNFGDSKVDED